MRDLLHPPLTTVEVENRHRFRTLDLYEQVRHINRLRETKKRETRQADDRFRGFVQDRIDALRQAFARSQWTQGT